MVRTVVRQVLPGLAVVSGQRVDWPPLQEKLLALPGLDSCPDRFEHSLMPTHAQVDLVAGIIVSIAGHVSRTVFVADLRDAFRPQPVNLTADQFQPPGHKGLVTLRQGSVDLLEQVVMTFTHQHFAQDDLTIRCLDRCQAARPVDHGGHRLDGSVQVVTLPTGWNHAVVWCEDIGTQLVFVLELPPSTLVSVRVATAPQTGNILDIRQG